MTVHIRSDNALNTSAGVSWSKPGEVVAVHDELLAQELLRMAGFHEVQPSEGRHEAPEPPLIVVVEQPVEKPSPRDVAKGKAVTEN